MKAITINNSSANSCHRKISRNLRMTVAVQT